jgi:malate dehydrogenase (oxaloacetate-decarboxylating)
MAIAAAHELALCARERGIHEESILPTMEEWQVPMRLAVATATKAQEQGLARVERTRDQIHILAESKVRAAHEAMRVLLREGLIVAPPAAKE